MTRCATGLIAGAAIVGALSAPVAASARTGPGPNPLTVGHAYRNGVVPTRSWLHAHPQFAPTRNASASNLSYGGGISGVGVTTGAEKVYLVFWGSQWGSQSTNSSGNLQFSGDPVNMAPDLQAFFRGLGTGADTWSGVMTQYCEGVATGSQTCGTTSHVAYPTGGALAGVWEDTSSAAPPAATGHQIGVEALAAANHFGNTTTASNRDAQYVVVSPTGTDPDLYQLQGFCAWHDYSGDSTLSGGAVGSPFPFAFTNLPYITDVGAACGENFVNAGSVGLLDGVTIVEGHEYEETITDQFPAGGWTDSTGAENGDKCAWISSGQGAAQNITLTTGTFAVQSTWANDFAGGTGGCEVSHPIVTNGTNTVTVTNPGSQTSIVGARVSLQMQATDSQSGQPLTWSASGLPTLSINSSSGLISGTPTTSGTSSVTVTATDTTGASGNAPFSWTVNPQSGNTVTVTNPGSQTSTVGTAVSLQMQATDSQSGQTFTWSGSGLPAGLSINSSSGLISGTPTTSRTSSVTVTATDTTGASGNARFSWTVNPQAANTVTVINPGSRSTKIGVAVSLQLQATDSQAGQTFTWTAIGLPLGLTVTAGGLIHGTPTVQGLYVVTVTATDTTGAQGSTSFLWTVLRRHH